jgi:ankyrin repeat protein
MSSWLRTSTNILLFILFLFDKRFCQTISSHPQIHQAVLSGDVEALKKTVRAFNEEKNLHGLHATLPDGSSALHFAVWLQQHEMVQILIDSGANVEAKTDMGQTAIHTSVNVGNMPILQILLGSAFDHSC